MDEGKVCGMAIPDEGPVLQEEEKAKPVFFIDGHRRGVDGAYIRYQQEKGNDKGIIQRPDPEDPVAVESGKISGLSFSIQEPTGDQVAGKDKEEVYASPAGKKTICGGDIMPDDDRDDGNAPESIQRWEISA
jgi:hypothetical protein